MKSFNIKNVIKKLGLAFFVLLLSVTFAACSNNDTNNTSTREKETSQSTESTDNVEKDENTEVKEDKETTTSENEEVAKDEESTEENKKEIFVTADQVKDVIDGKTDLDNYVIAEVTWGEADASEDYLKNHIPGAIHINTDTI